MNFISTLGLFLKKEWWLNWASITHFVMPFLFCATVTTLLSLLVDGPLMPDRLISFLWLSLLFAGVLRFVKGSDPENESQVYVLYRLNPRCGVPFYLAKLFFNFAYICVLFFVSFGLLILFHPIVGSGALLLKIGPVFLLWITGFCLLGTLFSNMLLGYEKRDATLALLLYPFLMPAMVALIKAFSYGIHGELILIESSWLYFLAIFDGIFFLMALYTQEYLFE